MGAKPGSCQKVARGAQRQGNLGGEMGTREREGEARDKTASKGDGLTAHVSHVLEFGQLMYPNNPPSLVNPYVHTPLDTARQELSSCCARPPATKCSHVLQ